MKKMTCSQLGGACEEEFEAETFEEMAELSRSHGQKMGQAGEPAHLAAMDKMNELMKDPAAMQKWIDSKRAEFAKL